MSPRAPAGLTALRVATALGLHHAGEQVYIQVVRFAGASQHLAQVASGKFCGGAGGRLRRGQSRRWIGWIGRPGNRLDRVNLPGRNLNIVILAAAQVKPHPARNLGEMVAAQGEAIAQGHTLAGARGGGEAKDGRADRRDE